MIGPGIVGMRVGVLVMIVGMRVGVLVMIAGMRVGVLVMIVGMRVLVLVMIVEMRMRVAMVMPVAVVRAGPALSEKDESDPRDDQPGQRAEPGVESLRHHVPGGIERHCT